MADTETLEEAATAEGDTTDVFLGTDPIYANLSCPDRTPGPLDEIGEAQLANEEACRGTEGEVVGYAEYRGGSAASDDDSDDDGDSDDASDDGDTESYDPGKHTVEEVLKYVDANPDAADAVLEAELDGKDRSGIVDALSE